MSLRRPTVLALDLEGTLISNAVSQIPRPGLFEFLSHCRELFPRVVMFTTVHEARFRQVAGGLVKEHYAPDWFAEMEYIHWHGATKDLKFVPGVDPAEIVLVDDFEKYVHPGQESQWLQIDYFDHPYSNTDIGLAKAISVLRRLISTERPPP